jgi:hypothetical protein
MTLNDQIVTRRRLAMKIRDDLASRGALLEVSQRHNIPYSSLWRCLHNGGEGTVFERIADVYGYERGSSPGVYKPRAVA